MEYLWAGRVLKTTIQRHVTFLTRPIPILMTSGQDWADECAFRAIRTYLSPLNTSHRSLQK